MEQGLSTTQAEKIQETAGLNTITATSTVSWLAVLLSQLPTLLNGILLIAATFSFVIRDVLDGIFILAIIILNALFGFVQEYRAEKSLEKLKSYAVPKARVIRDGAETEMAATGLVPGDVVILSEGDRVPADGTLLEVHHLEVDESILTGESLPVIHRTGDTIFMGTLVTQGNAHLRVVHIGTKTQFGQIAHSLSEITPDKTPLQKQLTSLSKSLSVIVLCLSALIIPLGLMQQREIIPLLLLAVSIGIAAVPEGLPAVITIALAIGTNRLAKRHALVRRLPAIETLGAIQVILVDKTGTLTQNTMEVREVWSPTPAATKLLTEASILGNTASLLKRGEGEKFDIIGDKTDGALLAWARTQPEIAEYLATGSIIDEYVFDPRLKTVSTLWQKNGVQHAFVRGAPEAIISRSRLTPPETEEVTKRYEVLAGKGFRVIAFGTKIEDHTRNLTREHVENHLTFLGLIGIYDPPRTEVKDALERARTAGIKTVMVTGDNELTALTIAKDIGLIDKDEDVVTGDDLARMSETELVLMLDKIRIFARTRPEDKLRLTTLYKRQGYVVGVTGDGVNDALALKRADVGIAIGQSGTDVAKEASDIILTDDNFATLIKAVEEGRMIYRNIVKAITYLLSGNLSELLFILFATLLHLPSPLLPTQILWINLVTDGLPALALAADSKDPDILRHKPRDPRVPILTRSRILLIAVIGTTVALGLVALFSILLQTQSYTAAQTIVFNTLIISHLCIAVLIRGKGFHRIPKFMLFTIGLTILLQIIISTTPLFQGIFHLGF